LTALNAVSAETQPTVTVPTSSGVGRCAACGMVAASPWTAIADWHYVACSGCGLVRLDPMPTAADAAQLYDNSYFTGSAQRGYAGYVQDERIHRLNARRHLRRLASAGAQPPGQLVEVGAAAGFLLDEARRQGWSVAGTDVAPSMRSSARELHRIELAAAVDDLDISPDGFDVAVAKQVLEHIVDPLTLLKDLRSRMRPGGLLSIETWDRGATVARLFGSRWQQVNPPSVLWLWDAGQLRRVIERAGFEVVRCRPALKLVSVATVTGQLGRVGPLRRMPIPYRLGDLVVLIGRVPA
jgi:SAM-dependent methyltransferase